jgi:hypothetical protein
MMDEKEGTTIVCALTMANLLILIISRGSTALTTHENDDRGNLAPLFIVAVAGVVFA